MPDFDEFDDLDDDLSLWDEYATGIPADFDQFDLERAIETVANHPAPPIFPAPEPPEIAPGFPHWMIQNEITGNAWTIAGREQPPVIRIPEIRIPDPNEYGLLLFWSSRGSGALDSNRVLGIDFGETGPEPEEPKDENLVPYTYQQ